MPGVHLGLASRSEGTGPKVVLVHGFTQTGESWRAVAAEMAGDHEVVTVDLPGHGGSSHLAGDLWQTADLLGDAGGPATYVGYSLGARVALHLGLRHPHLVHRLVLLGGTAGIEAAAGRTARRASDEALAGSIEEDGVDAFLHRWLAQPLFAGLPATERSGEALASRLANTAAGLAASLRLAGTGTQDPPLWDRLPDVEAPTLIMAGALDSKFAAIGQRLADGIGPDARLVTVPGAGHAAHLERPERFLAILRRWLAATEPGRS